MKFLRDGKWLTREQVLAYNKKLKGVPVAPVPEVVPEVAPVETVETTTSADTIVEMGTSTDVEVPVAPESAIGKAMKSVLYEQMDWTELKQLAKEKGLKLTNTQTKQDILQFLNNL